MEASDHEETQAGHQHAHSQPPGEGSGLTPSPSRDELKYEPLSEPLDASPSDSDPDQPLPVMHDSDQPIASSLPEGQSAFDDAPEPTHAQAPTLPDLDQPVAEASIHDLDEPAPLIGSSAPTEPSLESQPTLTPSPSQDAPEPTPAPLVAASIEPAPEPQPEEQPFFPTIQPEKPAQLTLAQKLALLKASLPAYPSPIQSPVKPITSLAAGFISPEPPSHQPTPAPAPLAQAPAPAQAPEPVQQAQEAPTQPAPDQELPPPIAAQAPAEPFDIPIETAQAFSQSLPEPGAESLPDAVAESMDDSQEETLDGSTLFELQPGDPDTEESGIYATAHTQATQDLKSCAASPVLALTRDVEDVPIEDAGHLRLPQSSSLKFTGAADDSQSSFAAGDEPPAPIPLVVSPAAAAGGTALALGIPGPDDKPSHASQPESKKSKSSRKRKNWWFIPASDDTPQSRQGKRIDRFAAICAVGVLGLMAVLGARVVQLQLTPDPKIAALVDSQNSKATLHYRRGVIEDRNGRALSLTRATKSVFVDPGIVTNAKSFSQDIGSALKIDPDTLQTRLQGAGDKRYIKIVRKANEDQADALPALLKNKELKPLGTETVLVRDYPYKNLAAHLLGFVNVDGKGIEGVERLFNDQLTGQNGAFTYERDSRHRSLWINNGQYQLPQDGQPVRLSIDITIQRIAEKELADSCAHFQAKSGAVIVMDPKTGELLALAVYPEVDANAFGKAAPELRKNHAITDTYEPGSTFKPFVWAIATEQGYARPLEMLDCGPGFWRSSTGRRLRDAHPVGRATWDEVLVKSSNIGMAIVGERMGPQALYNAVAAFGFGKPTGSGLPGEIGGIFHNVKKWTSYSVTSIPMGQEISVTPMQMARAYCALANGGTLITPTIQYVDPDSPQAQVPQGPQVLKPETAIHTRNVMRRVVLEGTGKQANSKLYSIFGKTGTAQMANPKGGGYEPDAYTGSFACGAPVQDPRIVVVTILQRPKRSIGYYGGTIAAPAGMRIVEQTLAYLGVAPDVVQEEKSKPKPPANNSRVLQVNNRAPGR